jgi:hypothetical protein
MNSVISEKANPFAVTNLASNPDGSTPFQRWIAYGSGGVRNVAPEKSRPSTVNGDQKTCPQQTITVERL